VIRHILVNKQQNRRQALIVSASLSALLLLPAQAFGAGDESAKAAHFGVAFMMLALVLFAGKLGSIVERFGQPAVIGELVAGIGLSALGYLGWGLVGEALNSEIIAFAAGFGALLLLFSIGLESNIQEMKKVGISALLVALVGVTVPFVLGTYALAPLLFPESSANTRLFIGASLVATSVGITCSVFRSLGMLKTRAAQTVLGAAIIDDVLGLIVLAVVSALVVGGDVTPAGVALIAAKSFGFLGVAILMGPYIAKPVSRMLRRIHSGVGMKIALALTFALVFGFIAELFGLEAIIGAFAAGLLLDQVHFKDYDDQPLVKDIRAHDFESLSDKKAMMSAANHHADKDVEDLIATIGHIFIPVFFVYTGMQIQFSSLLQPSLYVTAFIIALVAFLAKLVAGFVAKGTMQEKLLIGVSMVPRGEVGLIFAATGKSLGVLNDQVFSTIVLVVILTTFVSPPLIKALASDSSRIKKMPTRLRLAFAKE
jgi:Kef-type K+ transport system membrane component KefB